MRKHLAAWTAAACLFGSPFITAQWKLEAYQGWHTNTVTAVTADNETHVPRYLKRAKYLPWKRVYTKFGVKTTRPRNCRITVTCKSLDPGVALVCNSWGELRNHPLEVLDPRTRGPRTECAHVLSGRNPCRTYLGYRGFFVLGLRPGVARLELSAAGHDPEIVLVNVQMNPPLQQGGDARIGGVHDLLVNGVDPGLTYQMASSLTVGTVPLGSRTLHLGVDPLMVATVANNGTSVFRSYRGVIDPNGNAAAAIHLPDVPELVGLGIHSAFVTLDPQAPFGIRTVSNNVYFEIEG